MRLAGATAEAEGGPSALLLQGNGHERDKLHFCDDDTFILDMFGAALYPGDEPAKVVHDLNPYDPKPCKTSCEPQIWPRS